MVVQVYHTSLYQSINKQSNGKKTYISPRKL
nr:MAG TPA: hypothetical protein [Crassvirales sp.]